MSNKSTVRLDNADIAGLDWKSKFDDAPSSYRQRLQETRGRLMVGPGKSRFAQEGGFVGCMAKRNSQEMVIMEYGASLSGQPDHDYPSDDYPMESRRSGRMPRQRYHEEQARSQKPENKAAALLENIVDSGIKEDEDIGNQTNKMISRQERMGNKSKQELDNENSMAKQRRNRVQEPLRQTLLRLPSSSVLQAPLVQRSPPKRSPPKPTREPQITKLKG